MDDVAPEPAAALRTLVVDDEQPVLDELVYLLERDPRVGAVHTARSGAEALRRLEGGAVDLLFLDIAMPGLSGIDIARVVGQFRTPPRVVFVTAHEGHALEAFELGALDYLLKPIREERLRESIRRAVDQGDPADGAGHLVRTPLTGLVSDWEDVGFVRIHRSSAVNLAHVREVRMQAGRCSVVVPHGDGVVELQVSRRHTPTLRDLIHERSR